MSARKSPVVALFAGVLLGAVVAILPIAIPNNVASADQFKEPDDVPTRAENYVSALVQSRIQFVDSLDLPFVGWQFIDLRTGKTLRIKAGDMVPVEFEDGSTMYVVFTGIPSDQYGFHFRTIARSLRPPGYVRPHQRPVGGSPIGGRGDGTHHERGKGDHYVHNGSGGLGTGTVSPRPATCLSGNVGACSVTPGG